MSYLTQDYRRTLIRQPQPLLNGLDSVVNSWLGRFQRGSKKTTDFLQLADEVDSHESYYAAKTDKLLKKELGDFKTLFCRRPRHFQDQLTMALAAIREASSRCLGLYPYKVQLAGSLALYHGNLAEMATGEGKTLTAALCAVLHGWSGRPCHIITVNDYLAARDSRALSNFYQFCHLTVGHVTGDMKPMARRRGYANDITYTTSKEIVADFLRDRLWLRQSQNAARRHIRSFLQNRSAMERGLVMRGLHTAIVDEADSVLIDEAVTPLIISRSHPNESFMDACKQANRLAANLEAGVHYEVLERYKEVRLLPDTENQLKDDLKGTLNRGHSISQQLELVRQALTAREFFRRDQQYVLVDGKIVIVDEFTGRLMPQRSWQAGLHQLVEAKEQLKMTAPSETLARLSFQRFYRFFTHLSGMSGTAQEACEELWQIYNIPVVSIPENRPCKRKVYTTRVYADNSLKWREVVEEIKQMHRAGRPVLVGTRSIQASETLAAKLSAEGLAFNLLNAHKHGEEARIIEEAGSLKRITIATNMAGRGTDIKLQKGVEAIGGLHVIATECHESGRVDRQLFGRCARQGDPGSARLFVSLEDELLCRYLPNAVRRVVVAMLIRRVRGAETVAAWCLAWAQKSAQRRSYKQRRGVLRTDTWLNDSLSFAQGGDEIV